MLKPHHHTSSGYGNVSLDHKGRISWTKPKGNEIKGSSSMSSFTGGSLPRRPSSNNSNSSFASIKESISSNLLGAQRKTSRSGEANASWDGVNLAPRGNKEGTPSFYASKQNASSGSLQRMIAGRRQSCNDPFQTNGKSSMYSMAQTDGQPRRNSFLDMVKNDEDLTKGLRGLMSMSAPEKPSAANGFAWPSKDELEVNVEREKLPSRQSEGVFVCRPQADDGGDGLIVGFPESPEE